MSDEKQDVEKYSELLRELHRRQQLLLEQEIKVNTFVLRLLGSANFQGLDVVPCKKK